MNHRLLGKISKYLSISSLALAGTLLVSGCGDGTQDKSAQTRQMVLQGSAYLEQGQFRAAMIEAKNAIQNAPDNVDANVLLAGILNELGDAKGASKHLESFAGTPNELYYMKLAQAYLLRGKYKSTLDILAENESLSETNLENFYLYKARALYAQGKIEDSRDVYTTLLNTQPQNIEALLGLAQIDLDNNQMVKALERLSKIESIEENNVSALIFSAKIAAMKGEFSESESLLTRALSFQPNTDLITPLKMRILNSLADILTRQGKSDEAITYRKILAENNPIGHEIQSRHKQAIELIQEGDLSGAKASLDEVFKIAPTHSASKQLLGIINFLEGETEEAYALLNSNMDLETASSVLKHIYALTNLKLNQPEKVLEILKGQVDFSNNINVLTLYAIAALSSGETEKGLKYLNKSYAIDSTNPRTSIVLAKYYLSMSEPNYDKALSILQTSVAAHKNNELLNKTIFQVYNLQNNKAAAIALAQKLQTSEKTRALGLELEAVVLIQNKKFDQGAALLLEASRLKPTLTSLKMLGLAYILAKDFESASAVFQDLSEKHPDNTLGYRGLVAVAVANGDIEDVTNSLSKRAEEGKYFAAHQVLTQYHLSESQFEKAGHHLAQAKKIQPNSDINLGIEVELLFRQATVAFEKKEAEATRDFLAKVIELDSNHLKSLGLLASLEINTKNYAAAATLLSQIENENPWLAASLQGDLSSAKGNNEEAISAYRKAWDANTDDTLARKLHSRYVSTKQTNKSQAFLADWLETYPESIAALSFDSSHNLQLGRFQEAQEQLETILHKFPTSAVHLNNLAWTYHQLKDERALASAKRAYDVDQKNPSILDTYGVILISAGDYTKGIEMLEQSLSIDPDNKEVAEHLEKARNNQALNPQ